MDLSQDRLCNKWITDFEAVLCTFPYVINYYSSAQPHELHSFIVTFQNLDKSWTLALTVIVNSYDL